jgi:hypothetical protein
MIVCRMLETNSTVQITVLDDTAVVSPARITQSSTETVSLLAEKPAKPGAAIKLEGDDVLFLGEVSSCHSEGAGFAISVEIHHALYNTRELAQLAKRLLDEMDHL